MSNPFVYAELHTQNPEAAKDFYRRLLDWRMTDTPTPQGVYTEIEISGGFPAGLKRAVEAQTPSHWLFYIQVADVAAATDRAKQLGARPLQELVVVPDQGRFSVFADPTGALFGLWEKQAG